MKAFGANVTDGQTPDGYVVVEDVRVDISKSVRNAGRYLIQLYDAILAESGNKGLLSKICHGTDQPIEMNSDVRLAQFSAPRGTMGSEHGLATSQTDAIAAFSAMKSGDLLAVNGPPGTGKTTLLQSIIATEIVARALAGGDAAVMVCDYQGPTCLKPIARCPKRWTYGY